MKVIVGDGATDDPWGVELAFVVWSVEINRGFIYQSYFQDYYFSSVDSKGF